MQYGTMPDPGRTALYRFFADDDSLLYVGIATNPQARQHQHARDAAETWWKLVARRIDEWFETRVEAERAEVTAIAHERPRFNVRDNPVVTDDVRQVRDARAAKASRLPNQGPFPKYQQMAELIQRKIEAGELPRGARVPRREYATTFGIGIETVKRACEELVRAGVLERTGHGHCVPWNPATQSRVTVDVTDPTGAAASLRTAMTNEQLSALIAALQAAAEEAA